MEKQLYFVLGFVAAIVVAAPFVFGITQSVGLHFQNLSAVIFGMLLALAIFMFFCIIFRDAILHGLIGSTRTSLLEVSNTIGTIISYAVVGKTDELQNLSIELSRQVLAWYAWVGFYKWLIGTIIGLLSAFAVFGGAILMVEQNQELRAGNDTAREFSKIALTVQILLELSSSTELDASLKLIRETPAIKKGDVVTEELSKAQRTALNFYEGVSALAMRDALDMETLYEVAGGRMSELYNRSEYSILLTRCTSTRRTRFKIFERLELLVTCAFRKRAQDEIDGLPPGELKVSNSCVEEHNQRIRYPSYCEGIE